MVSVIMSALEHQKRMLERGVKLEGSDEKLA